MEFMTADPSGNPAGAQLILETEPSSESIGYLEEQLYDFNVRTTGIADGNLIGLFLRAPDGSPVGGLYGWTGEGPAMSAISLSPKACAGRAKVQG